MTSLIISLVFGGATGGILGLLSNPVADVILSYSFKSLGKLARGEHLSEADKKFIKEYNSHRVIYKGHDYTEQLKNQRIMDGW